MGRALICCVLLFVSLKRAQSDTMCDLSNTECSTQVANIIHRLIADGVPGISQPFDPAHVTDIQGQYISLNYKVPNSTLEGSGNCKSTALKLNFDDNTYNNEVLCTKLVLKYNYDVQGLSGPVELDGKGLATITYNDYLITFTGTFGHSISEPDNHNHFYIVNYDVRVVPSGPVDIDIDGSLHTDKQKEAKALAFVNEHKKEGGIIRGPAIMLAYMGKYITIYDAILREYSAENLFFS